MKRQPKFPLKFEKGIIGITRKRTTKDALKAFESFLLIKKGERCRQKYGRIDEAWVQRELQEALEMFGEEGFTKDHFEFLRREYAGMPRRAPRKKAKIKFDANGLPKVTKTPLNHLESEALIYLRDTSAGEK